MCMLERCIIHVHVREVQKEGKKCKQGHTNNKAKQHSTSTFPKKNSLTLSRVGFEPTTLHTLDRALYHVLDVNYSFVLTYFDKVIYYDYFSCPLRLVIIFL